MGHLTRRIRQQESRVGQGHVRWRQQYRATRDAVASSIGSPLGLGVGFGTGMFFGMRRPVYRKSDAPSLLRLLLPFATTFLQGLHLGKEMEDDDGDAPTTDG